MSTRSIILREIDTVAVEQGVTLAPLSDDLPLLDSGLDSLCFAILVSRLEDATGLDPFSASGAARYPRTIGELVQFYDEAHV
jgi:acyl carrier protein